MIRHVRKAGRHANAAERPMVFATVQSSAGLVMGPDHPVVLLRSVVSLSGTACLL
jgi:hypothetical protein